MISVASRQRIFMMKLILNAYILAGGQSRRLGKDKLYVQVDGQTLLENVVNICRKCFNEVKLVARDSTIISFSDIEIVIDSPKAEGPMAGVIAALENCPLDSCFITAVDLPDLNIEIVETLINNYEGQQYFGLEEAGGLQPLCGIYEKSALEVFYRSARNKNYSVTEVVRSLDYDLIDLKSRQWRNVNSPEDLTIGGIND
jgi:molybdopterin-guanine dinucleotide biosynthesis protein A